MGSHCWYRCNSYYYRFPYHNLLVCKTTKYNPHLTRPHHPTLIQITLTHSGDLHDKICHAEAGDVGEKERSLKNEDCCTLRYSWKPTSTERGARGTRWSATGPGCCWRRYSFRPDAPADAGAPGPAWEPRVFSSRKRRSRGSRCIRWTAVYSKDARGGA